MISEPYSYPDFQREETNSDTEWKLIIVYEQMEKTFETSFTE